MQYYKIPYEKREIKFSELLGKTIISIENKDDYELTIKCSDGSVYIQFHQDDCCESVTIESIVGDLNDLLNSPILVAEESTNDESHPEGFKEKDENGYSRVDESFTWTFYKLATIKGYVDIRWLGSSSGYYSESVEMARIIDPIN